MVEQLKPDDIIKLADAQARLIAAAPELLEALERSREGWLNAVEMGIIPPQHRNAAQILADEAATAIAKARGLGGGV